MNSDSHRSQPDLADLADRHALPCWPGGCDETLLCAENVWQPRSPGVSKERSARDTVRRCGLLASTPNGATETTRPLVCFCGYIYIYMFIIYNTNLDVLWLLLLILVLLVLLLVVVVVVVVVLLLLLLLLLGLRLLWQQLWLRLRSSSSSASFCCYYSCCSRRRCC